MPEIPVKETPIKELPLKDVFEEMQTLLRRRGTLVTRTIPNTNVQVSKYQYDGRVTFVEEALFGVSRHEEHGMNLHIEEEIPPSTDSYRDIRIVLKNPKLYEKNLHKKEMPGEALTEVVLVNPASGRKTKAMVYQFNPINEWLGLSKDQWEEAKDAIGSIWITESAEEAQKIVKLITAGQNQSSGAPYLTRRDFLKLIAATGTGAVILPKIPGFLKQGSIPRQYPEESVSDNSLLKQELQESPQISDEELLTMNKEQLQNYAEETFQIKILPLGRHNVGGAVTKPIEWDEQNLRGLIRGFQTIAPYFYFPRKLKDQVEKLNVSLIKYTGSNRCSCGDPGQPHLLELDITSFQEPDERAIEVWYGGIPELSLIPQHTQIIVHELTHRLTNPDSELPKYVDRISKPIGIETVETLHEVFQSVMYNSYKEPERANLIGYGARNFDEFFSVSAEVYIGGKDVFIKVYERFLGRERAEKLYEGVKQEIFRGREY